MSDPIKDAAKRLAERMRGFREWSRCEAEIGNTAIWEAADEAALKAYEDAVHEATAGVQLPFDIWEAV